MIEPGPREILPRGKRFPWFVFGADEAALPAVGADGVAQGGGEIQRRYAEGCSDLDDAASLHRPAKLIAEFAFGAIKRDHLVAEIFLEPAGSPPAEASFSVRLANMRASCSAFLA
jgi:hypothetical protein